MGWVLIRGLVKQTRGSKHWTIGHFFHCFGKGQQDLGRVLGIFIFHRSFCEFPGCGKNFLLGGGHSKILAWEGSPCTPTQWRNLLGGVKKWMDMCPTPAMECLVSLGFEWWITGVWMVYIKLLNNISLVFEWCFTGVWMLWSYCAFKFHWCLNGISLVYEWYFTGVWMVILYIYHHHSDTSDITIQTPVKGTFHWCLNGVWMGSEWGFSDVWMVLTGVWMIVVLVSEWCSTGVWMVISLGSEWNLFL